MDDMKAWARERYRKLANVSATAHSKALGALEDWVAIERGETPRPSVIDAYQCWRGMQPKETKPTTKTKRPHK